MSSQKIIITIGNENPTEETYSINGINFELRVVCILRAKEKGRNPSDYDSVRYMRHGKGFSKWWKQERMDEIVSQSVVNERLLETFQYIVEDCFFLQFVCVYVRQDDSCVKNWRKNSLKVWGESLMYVANVAIFL